MRATDTILAIATGPVASGVGVLRLSGPSSLSLARVLCPDVPVPARPRHAHFTRVTDSLGRLVDEGLFLFFPAPHSYTGEEVVEIHLHGSPRLLRLVEGALLSKGGLRPAQPGEFTRRAFLNGRIDLARAEAVADLIAAESEASVRAAAAQLRGALGLELAKIRAPLLELRADLEGVLEFPDEADGAEEGAAERIGAAARALEALVGTARRGALLRHGARVTLYGPVNAGKSTLFNRLVGEERALVDAEPGTTRDVLESRLELGGLSVTLLDTAGLREEAGRIEGLGIARARQAVASANLAVLVVPPEAEGQALAGWRAVAETTPLLEVLGKADLPGATGAAERLGLAVSVSGQTGQGVETLRRALERALLGPDENRMETAVSTRHADALGRALHALERARVASQMSTLEVVAGELGLALEALSEVTGENASEALLDSIFSRFCIGK